MCGFNASSDEQLLDAVSHTKRHHLSKHVVLLFDKMYVLVFSGALVGYVDLDEINGYLRDFECQTAQKSSGTSLRPVAIKLLPCSWLGAFSQFPMLFSHHA